VTGDIRASHVDGYYGSGAVRDGKTTNIAETCFKGGAQQFGVTDSVPAARRCADP